MTKIFSFILILSITTGCATSTPIIGPDGTENLLIESVSIENAYKKANQMCKGPYKIINTNSVATKDGKEFSLLVKCGN